MKIYKAKDYKDMSRKAANIISAQVIMKPNCVLGLATGSTPIGTYAQLVEWYNKGDLDFSEVTTVNLDEYKGLPRTNDQSYYYFMHQHLFDRVNIDPERTNVPNGMEPDAEKECGRYEELIRSLGGVDLQLLGLGHNGHIGFNEPGEAFETADAMFEGGQLAMNFAGSYMVPEYASNDAIKDKVDCVEIPTFNGKEDNCINGLGYAVFEGSKNKEAAEDFAIWLGSKEAQEIQGKTGVVISARTDAQKCFAEANSQYNLAAYTNHADEAYPLPVCTKAAELYDLEATELQKAYNGEESLSDVCKSLTKQADKLLQE